MASTKPRLEQLQSGPYLPFHLDINSSTEIWQRGAGPFTTTARFTADEWRMDFTGTSFSVTRNSTPLFGYYCLQGVYTKGAGTNATIRQGYEKYKYVEGAYVTFAAWVKTSTASAVRLQVSDYNGSSTETVTSAYHTGSGNWERLFITKLVRTGLVANAGLPHTFGLIVEVQVNLSCTFQLGATSFVMGNHNYRIDYFAEDAQMELTRCQRFYQRNIGGYADGSLWSGVTSNTGGATFRSQIVFSCQMYATPTVTLTNFANLGFAATVGTVTATSVGFSEVRQRTSSAYGGYFCSDWTAECT